MTPDNLPSSRALLAIFAEARARYVARQQYELAFVDNPVENAAVTAVKMSDPLTAYRHIARKQYYLLWTAARLSDNSERDSYTQMIKLQHRLGIVAHFFWHIHPDHFNNDDFKYGAEANIVRIRLLAKCRSEALNHLAVDVATAALDAMAVVPSRIGGAPNVAAAMIKAAAAAAFSNFHHCRAGANSLRNKALGTINAVAGPNDPRIKAIQNEAAQLNGAPAPWP